MIPRLLSKYWVSVSVGAGTGLIVFVLSGTAFFWVMYLLLVYVWPSTVGPGCNELATLWHP